MWTTIREFTDIKFERTDDGIAKITINRPEVRNAFRPLTVSEMKIALDMARDDSEVGVIILTGQGPEAFCSGGDQRVRGKGGYVDEKEKIPRHIRDQEFVSAASGPVSNRGRAED